MSEENPSDKPFNSGIRMLAIQLECLKAISELEGVTVEGLANRIIKEDLAPRAKELGLDDL